MSHAAWERLAAAAPDVELVPVEGWLEADRAVKEPAELERVAAACAVADRALAALLPEIRPGVTEAELALRLEWLMRTGGRRGARVRRRLPRRPGGGAAARLPGDRPVRRRPGPAVRLRGAGRRLSKRHDEDPVRGRPERRATWTSTSSWRRAQSAAIEAVEAAVGAGGAAGAAERPGHRRGRARRHRRRGARRPFRPRPRVTGSGSRPTRRRRSAGRASDEPLPSPTVFSVEPGVYLDGEMGVRIEDLVALDASAPARSSA